MFQEKTVVVANWTVINLLWGVRRSRKWTGWSVVRKQCLLSWIELAESCTCLFVMHKWSFHPVNANTLLHICIEPVHHIHQSDLALNTALHQFLDGLGCEVHVTLQQVVIGCVDIEQKSVNLSILRKRSDQRSSGLLLPHGSFHLICPNGDSTD